MARPDKVIYKYIFSAGSLLRLEVPIGSRIIHIGEQLEDELCVWVEQPVEYTDTETKTLFVIATGECIDDTNLRCEYFKTVVMRSMLVWHFYLGVD